VAATKANHPSSNTNSAVAATEANHPSSNTNCAVAATEANHPSSNTNSAVAATEANHPSSITKANAATTIQAKWRDALSKFRCDHEEQRPTSASRCVSVKLRITLSNAGFMYGGLLSGTGDPIADFGDGFDFNFEENDVSNESGESVCEISIPHDNISLTIVQTK
jgi:hypothetical protein